MKRTYRVKNFGNDRDYDDLDELLSGMRENYRGKSVAIHVETPKCGMTRVFFVDVTAAGDILESYSEKGLVRLDKSRLSEAAGD